MSSGGDGANEALSNAVAVAQQAVVGVAEHFAAMRYEYVPDRRVDADIGTDDEEADKGAQCRNWPRGISFHLALQV